MLKFIVPGTPQGKGRPRVSTIAGHAGMYTPARTVAYEGLVAHAAQAAMAGRPLIDGPVRLHLAIRAGWAAYLARRVPGLDRELPGIQALIRERTRELMQGAAC